MSLNEFIRHIRLQKAESLLKKGNYFVSEIIYQVGFTNHSYFAKCFKNQYGKTPKEFAKDFE
jgi:AraC-like DNA-binding protein